MQSCLNAATVRQDLSLPEFIAAAAIAGFEGIEVRMDAARAVARERGVANLKSLFQDAGVQPAGFGYGFPLRDPDEEFEDRLTSLSSLCELAVELGMPGGTMSLPHRRTAGGIESRTLLVDRLGAVADVAFRFGLNVYLEFIGLHHPPEDDGDFVKTIPAARGLISDIRRSNVGLLVDSYHCHLGGSTLEDIRQIPPSMPLFVHINDAPPGPVESLTDEMRVLPGDGVIDLRGFLGALRSIGYDGFVSLELFNEELRSLPLLETARQGQTAVRKVLSQLR